MILRRFLIIKFTLEIVSYNVSKDCLKTKYLIVVVYVKLLYERWFYEECICLCLYKGTELVSTIK